MAISTLLFSQSWKTSVTLSDITPTLHEPHEVAVTNDAVHILITEQNGGTKYLKYYAYEPDGTKIREVTLLTGDHNAVNIAEYNEEVFISYISGAYLTIKKSSNVGQSWSLFKSQYIGSNNHNGADLFINNHGVSISYSTETTPYHYETYYYRYNLNTSSTVHSKNVTDYSNGQGGFPHMTGYGDKIYVAYNTGMGLTADENSGYAKMRELTVSSNAWLSPVMIDQNDCSLSKIYTDGTKLYYFFTVAIPYRWELRYRERPLTSSTWSSSTFISESVDADTPLQFIETANGGKKIFYGYAGIGLYSKTYSGSSWTSETSVESGAAFNLAAVADYNDIYLGWYSTSGSCYKIKQYDNAPEVPSNYSIVASGNYHPLLSWDLVSGPDVKFNGGYDIYRSLNPTTNYLLLTSVSGTTLQYEDTGVNLPHPGGEAGSQKYYYKIRAKHPTNMYSSFTDYIDVTSASMIIEKKGEFDKLITDYRLLGNYPNPFNPSTNIVYQLPEKSNVTLKVYDVLGNEVAILLNEVQDSGEHNVKFDANALPSGMYIYSLLAGNFKQSGKMLLTK